MKRLILVGISLVLCSQAAAQSLPDYEIVAIIAAPAGTGPASEYKAYKIDRKKGVVIQCYATLVSGPGTMGGRCSTMSFGGDVPDFKTSTFATTVRVHTQHDQGGPSHALWTVNRTTGAVHFCIVAHKCIAVPEK